MFLFGDVGSSSSSLFGFDHILVLHLALFPFLSFPPVLSFFLFLSLIRMVLLCYRDTHAIAFLRYLLTILLRSGFSPFLGT
jgi:hypothetical protein